MKKVFICMLILITILTMVFTGCAKEEKSVESSAEEKQSIDENKPDEETKDETKKYKIGYAVKNLTNPYFLDQRDGVVETAAKLGAEVSVQATDKETEVEKQIQICENFLSQNFDAVIVAPLSSTSIVPFIKRCNDEGVPFVNIDTLADQKAMEEIGAESLFSVTTDNYAAGVECAKALISDLGNKGKVAVLEGTSGAQTAEDRNKGFLDVMQNSDIEIVASQPANYNRIKGYEVFQNILQANPDLDGLFAANDEMALGALRAIKDANMEGQISVVGINFAKDAQELIKEGKMLGSVTQGPYTLGQISVEKVIDYLNGKSIEKSYVTESVMKYKDDIK